MSDVVFALRRNASTDPPDDERIVLTDRGLLMHLVSRFYGPMWCHPDRTPVSADPSWWLDVRPSNEPLTVDDLQDILDAAVIGVNEMGGYPGELPMYVARTARATGRLRVALDALTRKRINDEKQSPDERRKQLVKVGSPEDISAFVKRTLEKLAPSIQSSIGFRAEEEDE